MNSQTSGPSTNCPELLVSDRTIFFDRNTCFLIDVLVSKQIWYLPDFDQIVFIYIYIYHENIEDKFSYKKIKRVRTKVLIKSFRNREPVNFFKVFHSNVTSVI